MNLEEIKEKIEELLERADGASMDKNRRDSLLERATVWIKYYEAQAKVESLPRIK